MGCQRCSQQQPLDGLGRTRPNENAYFQSSAVEVLAKGSSLSLRAACSPTTSRQTTEVIRLGRGNTDAGVDDGHALAVDENRVAVELGDLGKIVDHPAKTQ
jgi:hypothetical protein